MRILVIASAMLLSTQAVAGQRLVKAVTSSDQVGLAVTGKGKGVRGASAMMGMWSDDGAIELGGFDDRRGHVDPATARAAAIVSGRAMQSRGVRMVGSFYRNASAGARGWTVSVDARRQQVTDLGAALTGSWRTLDESRLTVGGKLRF